MYRAMVLSVCYQPGQSKDYLVTVYVRIYKHEILIDALYARKQHK
jgi:hypothetical protein